jgi:hypothetical protein
VAPHPTLHSLSSSLASAGTLIGCRHACPGIQQEQHEADDRESRDVTDEVSPLSRIEYGLESHDDGMDEAGPCRAGDPPPVSCAAPARLARSRHPEDLDPS